VSTTEKRIFLAGVVPFVPLFFGWPPHGLTVTLQLPLPWILAGVVACRPQLFSLEFIKSKGFTRGAPPYFVGGPYIGDYLLVFWFLYVVPVDWTRLV
jgi:hypothetical protein